MTNNTFTNNFHTGMDEKHYCHKVHKWCETKTHTHCSLPKTQLKICI